MFYVFAVVKELMSRLKYVFSVFETKEKDRQYYASYLWVAHASHPHEMACLKCVFHVFLHDSIMRHTCGSHMPHVLMRSLA